MRIYYGTIYSEISIYSEICWISFGIKHFRSQCLKLVILE